MTAKCYLHDLIRSVRSGSPASQQNADELGQREHAVRIVVVSPLGSVDLCPPPKPAAIDTITALTANGINPLAILRRRRR